MHELGITENIVAIAIEYAQGAYVKQITLEIGQLSAIMPEAIRFCFDVCCCDTVLEKATLEIIEIPGLARCRQCKTTMSVNQPWGICDHCGSVELEIIQGEELKIKEMEVEEICV